MDKITEQDLANRGVKGLPDVPGLTTEEMQRKLEEIAREILIPKVNELVEGLNNANSNFNVGYGIMTSDKTMFWYRYGRIAIISILNCIPNTAEQIATAPEPEGSFYAAVTSIDLSDSIWSIGDAGNVYIAAGDASKQYTGQIVYICK